MAARKGNARWEGGLRDGKGTMELGTQAYSGPYTYKSRFEEGTGTNPEELIGAAHAGCFSMQLAALLGNQGAEPESVNTEARVQLLKDGDGFSIKRIDLTTRVRASGIEEDAFQDAVQQAKDGCIISRALAGVGEMNVDATLER